MQNITLLEEDNYYHIFNCGINGEDLFREEENYEYFLRLYDKHITPIADTYAWCLMKNHFHLLIKIKPFLNLTGFGNLSGLKTTKTKPPHQYFSNLFNAYSKAINKRYGRHGSLFERPFKRKHIDDEDYLQTVVVYIHNNPVKHGFTNDVADWPWSSYNSCLSTEPTKLKRKEVIEMFDDVDNFKYLHQQKVESIKIDMFLEINDNF